MKKEMNTKGYSLVEMLVVLVLFSVLAVIATQTLFLSIRGTKKSGNVILVRNNVDHAIGVMERHLRNAKVWQSCEAATGIITYTDADDLSDQTFNCAGPSFDYIASGSARLTSDEVSVVCTLDCSEFETGRPPSLKINVSGTEAAAVGVEGSTIEIQTQIYLRNYN